MGPRPPAATAVSSSPGRTAEEQSTTSDVFIPRGPAEVKSLVPVPQRVQATRPSHSECKQDPSPARDTKAE